MKFIWEPQDIRGGRRFFTPAGEPSIIAYDVMHKDGRYAAVSLQDGLIVVQGKTNAGMAEYLTNYNAIPEAVG